MPEKLLAVFSWQIRRRERVKAKDQVRLHPNKTQNNLQRSVLSNAKLNGKDV